MSRSLSPERWARIEPILDRAFELEPAERSDWLKTACDGDEELQADVQRFLDAEAGAPSFLERPAAEFVEHALEEITESARIGGPAPGERVGPYRLVREIGRGGSSVVYLAERDDGQFRNRVAVKLLQPLHVDREEHLRRFLAEREILASLNHPHIARVLDGGATEQGWPFLAMEYVDGATLTDHCQLRAVPLNERLDLFIDVCEAVQHAHQRLIVHRDLKPTNILVAPAAEGESRDTVKLLDFGIAKLIGEHAARAADTPHTRTGLLLMTPGYAAPEQVRGEAITTATDVYALGVVLYEMLTGRRPYRLEGCSAGEIERRITTEEPPRPSAVTGEASEEPGLPEALPRHLRGDLDAIVLKALRKEPAGRYRSVQELAEDLRRHRRGLPVEARLPTRRYRMAKFVRRHRLGVAVAGVFLLTLIGFGAAMAVQQAETARERDRARLEAERSQELSDFMLGLFEATDPNATRGETVTAEDLLDRGAERAVELDTQPLVRARMLDVMGKAYRALGNYERAGDVLEEALAILREDPDRFRTDRARVANLLAVVRRRQNDYEAARPLYAEALEAYRAEGDRAGEATVLQNYGFFLVRLGEYDEAEPLLREGVALTEALRGPEHEDTADAVSKLTQLEFSRGDYAAAVPHARRALEISRATRGEHTRTAVLASNLGAALRRTGDFDGAEALYREALAIQRKLLGDRHPNVAVTLANLGQLLRARGQPAEAEPVMREAVDISLETLGRRNRQSATAMNNHGMILYQLERLDEAQARFEAALAIRRELYGESHPAVAQSLHNLGALDIELGRSERALERMQAAHAIYAERFSPTHERAANVAARLGALLLDLGRCGESRTWLERALTGYLERHDPGDDRIADTRAGLDRARACASTADAS